MKKSNLWLQITLLTTLITNLSITGFGLLDNLLWNKIMLWIGMIAYSVVSFLYSMHFINSRQQGRMSYRYVLVLLLIGLGIVYSAIAYIQQWILSWHIAFKITVIALLAILIILTFVNMVIDKKKENA